MVVAQEVLGLSMQNDSSILKDVSFLGHVQGTENVLLYQEDGGALFVDVEDRTKDLPHQYRRQPQ